MNYQVEVRDLKSRGFSCTCPDFRINRLNTCKHVEAVLIRIKRRHKGAVRAAENLGSTRIDLVPSGKSLRTFAADLAGEAEPHQHAAEKALAEASAIECDPAVPAGFQPSATD